MDRSVSLRHTDEMPHPRVVPLRGDITKLAVDAIVNAANSALSVGGGVDGAIHEAAGEQELSAACAELGGCETGDAKATPGFRLPARWVIHAVGPVWQGGRHGEAKLLASCYRRAVEVAQDLDVRTMAFPAISTGIFGFPSEQAAQIAVSTLRGLDTTVERMILVAFDKETLRLYERLLGD
jgi:O-acetyl-ADP-ribose deacetylase (regulator of RNase III)